MFVLNCIVRLNDMAAEKLFETLDSCCPTFQFSNLKLTTVEIDGLLHIVEGQERGTGRDAPLAKQSEGRMEDRIELACVVVPTETPVWTTSDTDFLM